MKTDIIDFFMTVGTLPALFVVGVLDMLLPFDVASTFFAGAVAFFFGVAITACFFIGVWTIFA